MVLSRLVSFDDLKTSYGVKDLYEILEIISINEYNDYLFQKGSTEKKDFKTELLNRQNQME